MEDSNKLVDAKFFSEASLAEIYSARLRDLDIPHLLKDKYIHSVLHMANSYVRLQVYEKDLEQVQELFEELDQLHESNEAESFHEADKDEIYYQKALNTNPITSNWLYTVLLIVFILVVLLLLVSSPNFI